ncbi:gamma-glutamyltransferase [Endozoicomonas sp.]|nr:gamma-glutamyltransferase [Endozoicomonas sp.]
MIKILSKLLCFSSLYLSLFPVLASDVADAVAPEEGTRKTQQLLVKAKQFMVAAANPYATEAGYDILKKGGSAVDAMIAVQLVLNLVEPQSSGIGGGAFIVYFDGKKDQLTTWDGRETAPEKASPTLFMEQKAKPLSFYDAVVGGRSVATPGTPMLMYTMHQQYGKLPWQVLLQPAIKLAEQGFIVSERLASLIANDRQRLSRYPSTKAYFFPDGKSLKEGALLKNPEFANTLTLMAAEGVKPFYHGVIGQDIVKAVQSMDDNSGYLSLTDLKNYTVKERPPVCIDYRQYDVCGMGPPSSGALTIGQILGMVEHYDLAAYGPESPASWRLIGGASRLAFADRGLYIADTDFVDIPSGLLNDVYLADRAKLLEQPKALDNVDAGIPPGASKLARANDESIELPSTSHISIVDKEGNALSMTTTIENGFGSRLMVRGFLLNNEMTDFSFVPEKNGKPVANRIEAGKRPRSSMAPTIVFKKGKPYLVIGSPGGSRIIGYVAKTLIAHLDWQLPIDEAISLPHLVNRFGTYDLEQGTSAEELKGSLEKMGYQVNSRDLNSGLQAIVIKKQGLEGAADPRREGMVKGQ